MTRGALFLSLLLLAPCWAEDTVSARRREAQALAADRRWDDAASAFLEVAQARQEGWEAAALDAKACAARAVAARGETETAFAALRQVLDKDPANALALAGLASLDVNKEVPKPELPVPPPPAPEPPAPVPTAPEPAPAASGNPCREAQDLYKSGRLLEARVKLRQCLSLKPGDKEALALSEKVSRGLVEQAERSFRRHDRPDPEKPPPQESARLRRRGEPVPVIAPPPAPPEPRVAEAAPAPASPESDRQASLAQARARALTLMKSEQFDMAQAALEAIRAAHPEAKDLIDEDLAALAQARAKSATRRETEARAQAEAEAARQKAVAEAERAAQEAHRREAYAAAEALYARGDLAGAKAAFSALPPGTGKSAEYLAAIDKALAGRRQAERESALAAAREQLAQGRFEDALKALAPLDASDPDAAALRARIGEAETRHARETAKSQGQAAVQARKAAIEAAIALARQDPKAARARLYELNAQDPGNPDVPEAIRQVDAIEQNNQGSDAVPVERRRAEAVAHLNEEKLQKMLDALAAQAKGLYEGGYLEEARKRLTRVAEEAPGTRDADGLLSRIDEALRLRGELGTGPDKAPPSTDVRYVQGMALYDLNDLIPAADLLTPLSSAQDLTLWKRQRVARALADIARRRERARTLLETTGT